MRLEPFPEPPLVKIRYPVVLMHGVGVLSSLRRGGHLHGTALALRQHGVPAYAPNVPPYNPVTVRAGTWQERILHILRETGAPRVNLIGHSMGGLDARYIISRLGMHEVVASLVTISSPHYGTSLCDIIREQPSFFQSAAGALFDRMGTAAMKDVPGNTKQVIAELTPAYVCETFNREVHDHPSVKYWSYAGQAGKGTDVPINPLMWLQNRRIYRRQGINDGFVPVSSAQWGEFLGTIDADHSLQVGIRLVRNRRFDADAFYLSVVEMLAAEGY
jgi:triacylglycerol lipase